MSKYTKLRTALKNARFNQCDIAFRLGCTPQHMSRIMNGRNSAEFTISQIAFISQLLGLGAEELHKYFPELPKAKRTYSNAVLRVKRMNKVYTRQLQTNHDTQSGNIYS